MYLDENLMQGKYYKINVSQTKFQPKWIIHPDYLDQIM